MALSYVPERLSGSDRDSVLTPGTIVALRTSEGNVAKLKVLGYRALHDFDFPEASALSQQWRDSVLQQADCSNYHLEVEWVLYRVSPQEN